ncbi:Superoxide dismutase [Striga hermonthica]|uniref:superoxide dismutase n=1 Tax=Striga hermonthica TaxID=68872 RepID=A0A9N7N9S8_STRHE|nr:Superoxide dismutase [Striga hermonthica]
MYLRTLFLRRLSTKPPINPLATQRLSLPPLEYGYLDYEPAIRNDIMWLHHTEHHQAYVTNFNKALDQLDSATASGDASAVVKLQEVLKFNAGGHINHSLFWKCIAPCRERGGEPPRDGLCWAIKKNFGCLESLKQKMTTEAAALPGSGWVWLGVDCKHIKRLIVETTANDGSDKLSKSWNNMYLGAYQAAIDDNNIPDLSSDEIVDRNYIIYRSCICLGSYQRVIDEVDSAAAIDLQAVKLLKPLYFSSPTNKLI